MRIKSMIVVSLLFSIIVSHGCGSCGKLSDEEKKALTEAGELLWDAGINPKTLKKSGGDMEIEYETSTALHYDDEASVEWGSIFGILQWYADDEVVIINTVEGKPIARISAEVDDIKDFSKGEMSREEFFNKLSITPDG